MRRHGLVNTENVPPAQTVPSELVPLLFAPTATVDDPLASPSEPVTDWPGSAGDGLVRYASGSEVVAVDEIEPADDPTVVEVRVGGAPPAPRPACSCSKYHAEVTVALVAANEDGSGPVVGRQLKLQVVCAECGRVGRFDTSSARPSNVDGDLAVVVDFAPA